MLPASSLHIVLYNWLKPFLEEAKRKGFHVSPDTHIKIVAVLSQCADKIDDETVLFDYFSPLIAKNKEDYQLLKNEWEKWCGREKLIVDRKPPAKKRKPRYRWLIVPVVALILLFAGWLLYLFFTAKSAIADYRISYTDVTRPVQFDAMKSVSDSADTAHIKFAWNFGDGTTDTSAKAVILHTYHKPQFYATSLTLLPRDSDISILRRQLKTPFTLCKPALYIVQQPNENITTGNEVAFSVNYDSHYPASGKMEWTINGEVAAENKATFPTQFDSAGTYTITYKDAVYTAGTHCDSTTTLSVTVKSSSALDFMLSQTGSLIEPPLQVNWHDIAGLIIVALFLMGQYLANKKKQRGENKETTSRSADVMAKLKGMKPPYEIPFTNKDDIIDDEPLLPVLAKNFKRRIADENLYLNIPLTISSTITSEGFLLPVFTQKTKPSEYLILIDKSRVKSAQVKLFEYLVKRFAKSDIYTDTFYFYDKPDYGFNAFYPKGIYISRLYDLYPDHTVIIFGDGYSFIDKYYPALSEAATLPYTKWTNHVIFTPVPYNDWGGKEVLLQKRFLLLPADMEGQLLLFNFIDQPETFTSAGLQPLQSLYKAKGFNANKAEKIKTYLNDDFLFQWLCAMAVSPSIYWQTMLGIGDALQKERYYNEVIQYSSLLKLVRISWMRDAAFPEEVRLELLKNLEPQNEKIARQTMIRMMNEALLKTDENSFAFEELYLQQLTDKFVLYASNANDEEFKNYKTAHDKFKALWKDDKITDVVLKEYLKKEDGGEWSTLPGNENLVNSPQSGVSINDLFGDSNPASKTKWRKLQNTAILSLICLMALFAVSIFLFKNQWNHTLVNDKLKMVLADTGATVPFTFRVMYNQCLNSLQRQRDSTIFTLDFGDNNQLSLAEKDTAMLKKIPYSWLNQRLVALHISSRNEAYHFDSSFILSSTRLSLSMNGCAMYCNQWTKIETVNLESRYSGDWYDNSIINGTNTSYQPLHIESNAINGEKIMEMNSCENNNPLLRVITQSADASFDLYYLSQTQAGSISFAKHNAAYKTLEAAEKDTSAFSLSGRIALVSDPKSFASSHNFFSTFNGRWKTDDSADIMDISPVQNTIVLDNKYTFTVPDEKQTKTTSGRPLYKLSILKSGTIQGQTPNSPPAEESNLYLLLLDSTRAFISGEEKDSGAMPYAIANMGTFQLMHKQQTTVVAETPATLPQSLNEIWHGEISNRLMTLFLPKNVIYYSVNDTKTYGTYNINKVSLLSDGTYKIITKTDAGYKLFFIKNVTTTSFNLSVCQNFLPTKEEAISKTAADCDHFNTMTLYYENDPSVIYLPVSFSNNLVASQKTKLDNIVAAVNHKTDIITGFDVELSYSPSNLSNTVAFMNSFLQKNGIANKIKNSDVHSSTINRPFTRSYIEIKTEPVTGVTTSHWTDSNNVKQEAHTETNLGNIQFDEKSGVPDSKGLQLIEAIAGQLKKEATSRIKINASYNTKEDYKTAQEYLHTILVLLKKDNVQVSRTDKLLQVDTTLQQTLVPAIQQRTKISIVSKVRPVTGSVSVSTTGINFPDGFNVNNSQKAY